ncbi:MAG: glycosyltransferase [Myxococcota bacterium]|nr:glycosyltransferase [Myxococcota bacterium]
MHERRLTVLQAKFAAYLSWSQPFLHALISRLGEHVDNVILCNRTENLDRFPVEHVERLPTRYLVQPRLGVLAASYLQRTWQPDLMHAHFGWSGLRTLLQKQLLRIPLVVTFGGRDAGLQMGLEHFDRLYAALIEASDAIICVSHDLRDKLLAGGADPDRLHVIHRGADLDGFAFVDRSERPPARRARVLMVGRIVEKKGHRYALDALARLKQQGIDAEIVVVGEGEGYHLLRRQRRQLGLGDRVETVGMTDHAGVRKHMAEADLLLHCSVTPPGGDVEGIPNVVVEAQATGLPVIGTRHGGIPEAMRDGETGLLVDERDVDGLTDALARLLRDRDERLDMGRRARDFVGEHFDVSRQVERHLAIYEKVMTRAADPAWRETNWLPDDYCALMERTVLAQRIDHPSEFSIAELLERLVWARRFDAEVGEGAGALHGVARSGVFLPEAARIAPGRAAGDGASSGKGSAQSPGKGASAEDPGESTLERIYNLKGLIPQSIKFPIKMSLGRALASAIEWRYRRRHGEALAALEQADDRVFQFFRAGGTLAAWEEQSAEQWAARTDGAPPG